MVTLIFSLFLKAKIGRYREKTWNKNDVFIFSSAYELMCIKIIFSAQQQILSFPP